MRCRAVILIRPFIYGVGLKEKGLVAPGWAGGERVCHNTAFPLDNYLLWIYTSNIYFLNYGHGSLVIDREQLHYEHDTRN